MANHEFDPVESGGLDEGIAFVGGFVFEAYVGPDEGPVGIVLDGFPPHPVIVDRIDRGRAPEELSSVCEGDVLTSINSVDVQVMPPGELAFALQQRPLTLQFLRKTSEPVDELRYPPTQAPPKKRFYMNVEDSNTVSVGRSQRVSRRLRETMESAPVQYEIRAYLGERLLGIVPGSWPPGPVILESVVSNSIAERHGAQVGDVLMSINGEHVHGLTRTALIAKLRQRPLILDMERPSPRFAKDTGPAGYVIPELGKYFISFGFDDTVMGIIPGTWPPGPVHIEAVVDRSVAAAKGVLPGDVLLAVDGKDVTAMSRNELVEELLLRPVTLEFMRGPGLWGQDGRPQNILTPMPSMTHIPTSPPSRSAGKGQKPKPPGSEVGTQTSHDEDKRHSSPLEQLPDSMRPRSDDMGKQDTPEEATETRRSSIIQAGETSTDGQTIVDDDDIIGIFEAPPDSSSDDGVEWKPDEEPIWEPHLESDLVDEVEDAVEEPQAKDIDEDKAEDRDIDKLEVAEVQGLEEPAAEEAEEEEETKEDEQIKDGEEDEDDFNFDDDSDFDELFSFLDLPPPPGETDEQREARERLEKMVLALVESSSGMTAQLTKLTDEVAHLKYKSASEEPVAVTLPPPMPSAPPPQGAFPILFGVERVVDKVCRVRVTRLFDGRLGMKLDDEMKVAKITDAGASEFFDLGDKVLAVNGRAVGSKLELAEEMKALKEPPITFTVVRRDESDDDHPPQEVVSKIKVVQTHRFDDSLGIACDKLVVNEIINAGASEFWQIGDAIQEVNGVPVSSNKELARELQLNRSLPITFSVNRTSKNKRNQRPLLNEGSKDVIVRVHELYKESLGINLSESLYITGFSIAEAEQVWYVGDRIKSVNGVAVRSEVDVYREIGRSLGKSDDGPRLDDFIQRKRKGRRGGRAKKLIPLLDNEAIWKDVLIQADLSRKAISTDTQTEMKRTDFEKATRELPATPNFPTFEKETPQKMRRRRGYLSDLVSLLEDRISNAQFESVVLHVWHLFADASQTSASAALGLHVTEKELCVEDILVPSALQLWRIGDFIQALNGVPVTSISDLDKQLAKVQRVPITFTVLRQVRKESKRFISHEDLSSLDSLEPISAREDQPKSEPISFQVDALFNGRLGVGLRNDLVVSSIDVPDAARFWQMGDKILAVNGKKVERLEDLGKALGKKELPLLFKVQRNARQSELVAEDLQAFTISVTKLFDGRLGVAIKELVVTSIASPGAEEFWCVGDKILAVNGKPVLTMEEMSRALGKKELPMAFKVERRVGIKSPRNEKPDIDQRVRSNHPAPNVDPDGKTKIPETIVCVTRLFDGGLGIDLQYGMIVSSIQPGAEEFWQIKDKLVAVNGNPVQNTAELRKALGKQELPVICKIQRDTTILRVSKLFNGRLGVTFKKGLVVSSLAVPEAGEFWKLDDEIVGVNGKAVAFPDEMIEALGEKKLPIVFTIRRVQAEDNNQPQPPSETIVMRMEKLFNGQLGVSFTDGFVVSSIDDSDAQQFWQIGDQILAIDGQEVSTMLDMRKALAKKNPPISFKLKRLIASDRIDDGIAKAKQIEARKTIVSVIVTELSKGRELGVTMLPGLIVSSIDCEEAAAFWRVGDRIVAVNGQKIQKSIEMFQLLASQELPICFTVERLVDSVPEPAESGTETIVQVYRLYNNSLGIRVSGNLVVTGFDVKEAENFWCINDKILTVQGNLVRTKSEFAKEVGRLQTAPYIFTVSRRDSKARKNLVQLLKKEAYTNTEVKLDKLLNGGLGVSLKREGLIVHKFEDPEAKVYWRLEDRIVAVNGVAVKFQKDLQDILTNVKRMPIVFKVERRLESTESKDSTKPARVVTHVTSEPTTVKLDKLFNGGLGVHFRGNSPVVARIDEKEAMGVWQIDDCIEAVNGIPVNTVDALNGELTKMKYKLPVTFSITRRVESVGKRPARPKAEEITLRVRKLFDGKLGVRFDTSDASILGGIVSFDVSEAAKIWRLEDVVQDINGIPVRSPNEFVNEFRKAKEKLPIVFSVMRHRPDPPGTESGFASLAKGWSEPDEVLPAGLTVAPGMRGTNIVPNPLKPPTFSSEAAKPSTRLPEPPPTRMSEHNLASDLQHLAIVRRRLADLKEDEDAAEIDKEAAELLVELGANPPLRPVGIVQHNVDPDEADWAAAELFADLAVDGGEPTHDLWEPNIARFKFLHEVLTEPMPEFWPDREPPTQHFRPGSPLAQSVSRDSPRNAWRLRQIDRLAELGDEAEEAFQHRVEPSKEVVPDNMFFDEWRLRQVRLKAGLEDLPVVPDWEKCQPDDDDDAY